MSVTEESLVELISWHMRHFGTVPASISIPYDDWHMLQIKCVDKTKYGNNTILKDMKSFQYQGIPMFPGGRRIEVQMPMEKGLRW